ncbi:hypothetical protein FDK15_04590, partial [Geobacillus thermoleovorans]
MNAWTKKGCFAFIFLIMFFAPADYISNREKRSIPVRSFSGDLIKKSPLGMMQGCQTHHSP